MASPGTGTGPGGHHHLKFWHHRRDSDGGHGAVGSELAAAAGRPGRPAATVTVTQS
jgi:hypothetical protein